MQERVAIGLAESYSERKGVRELLKGGFESSVPRNLLVLLLEKAKFPAPHALNSFLKAPTLGLNLDPSYD